MTLPHPRLNESGSSLAWLACLVFYPAPWIFRSPSPQDVQISVVAVAVFLVLYVFSVRDGSIRLLICAILTLLIAVLVAPIEANWTVFVIFAATMFGRLDNRLRAFRGIVGACLVAGLTGLMTRQPWFWWFPGIALSALIGLSTNKSFELARENKYLSLCRETVRLEGILEERERISHDLHDLLGRSLTTIAVKAELAARLLARHDDASMGEIQEVAELARTSLTEVRRYVRGAGSVNLARELLSAEKVLAAAGIAVTVERTAPALSFTADSALALSLREAITNLVRHSGADRCKIRLEEGTDTIELSVQDNGQGCKGIDGFGLSGIRKRLGEIGGTIELVDLNPGLQFRATLPRGAL